MHSSEAVNCALKRPTKRDIVKKIMSSGMSLVSGYGLPSRRAYFLLDVSHKRYLPSGTSQTKTMTWKALRKRSGLKNVFLEALWEGTTFLLRILQCNSAN